MLVIGKGNLLDIKEELEYYRARYIIGRIEMEKSKRQGGWEAWRKNGPSQEAKKGSRRLINRKWILLVLITTALLVAGGMFRDHDDGQVDASRPIERIDVASTIYDVNNRPATKLGSTNKEYVHMEDVRSRQTD